MMHLREILLFFYKLYCTTAFGGISQTFFEFYAKGQAQYLSFDKCYLKSEERVKDIMEKIEKEEINGYKYFTN